uniref:Uncharacterized protein n=1 Tax=viral metagenome TaxID=1070528 RepID=A0A6C0K0D2_9ZZZZ
MSKSILEGADGFAAVCAKMLGSSPAGVGKLGTIELELVYTYFKLGSLPPQPQRLLTTLCRNAGLFPPTPAAAIQIAKELLDSLTAMTTLSPWWQIEPTLELFQSKAPLATHVSLQSLECFLSPDPTHWWTAHLPPKTRVLVISPFATTIQRQIPNLDKALPNLWSKDLIFNTITMPLSWGIQSSEMQHKMLATYTNSVGLLEDLKKQMDTMPYDLVLVGAGLYSLPLVAHAVRQGKKGIHLGGATQLFFGIRGNRWDTMPQFQRFFNEFWTRPTAEETPAQFQQVERGCYW